MKAASLLSPAAAIAVFAIAALAVSAGAQAPLPAQPPADQTAPAAPHGPAMQGGHPMHNFPAPTNLQVLPKNITGRELIETMENWSGSLGVHCNFCHAAEPNGVGPNGRPRLNFPDDSKPEKQIARVMYTMTQQINKNYIAKAMDLDKDGMGTPVTCGTCHRGHQMPEEFVVQREEHHGGPGGGAGAPLANGAPPAN